MSPASKHRIRNVSVVFVTHVTSAASRLSCLSSADYTIILFVSLLSNQCIIHSKNILYHLIHLILQFSKYITQNISYYFLMFVLYLFYVYVYIGLYEAEEGHWLTLNIHKVPNVVGAYPHNQINIKTRSWPKTCTCLFKYILTQ